jgi:hypothetical protein
MRFRYVAAVGLLGVALAITVGFSFSPQRRPLPMTGFDPIIVTGSDLTVEDRSGTPGIMTGFDPIIGMNPKANKETTITVSLDPGQSPEIVNGETYRVEVVLSGNWSPAGCTFTAKAGYGAKYGFYATPNDEQNATATATTFRKVDGEWKKVDVRTTAFQVNEAY